MSSETNQPRSSPRLPLVYAVPRTSAQLHVEIYEAVVTVANEMARPAAALDVASVVRCATHTARRHLKALVVEGELFVAPILPGMAGGVRQHHKGYLPSDESRTGGRCLCECSWPGCIKAPAVMKRHPQTGHMAGWCSQHIKGWADERAEREWSLEQVARRHSSAQSCGGWEPPSRPERYVSVESD